MAKLTMREKIEAAIRFKRNALCWSQKKLAEKSGVSWITILRIESGASVGTRFVEPVLDALGLEIEVKKMEAE